ncbi:hypothetical protein ACN28G_29275 [Micromonospora sp. WMMA1923]|uniref:hypothetical protein n=1 Tax=Micromonospora sp. WMMA1923 TaxID=3404125 RepID=UPI003B9417BD
MKLDLRAGDILHITRACSVQFGVPIFFRLIRVLDLQTYCGWVWLDGYELDSAGDATRRREIFVRVEGIRRMAMPGRSTPAQRSQPVDREITRRVGLRGVPR